MLRKLLERVFPEEWAEVVAVLVVIAARAWGMWQRCQSREEAIAALDGKPATDTLSPGGPERNDGPPG